MTNLVEKAPLLSERIFMPAISLPDATLLLVRQQLQAGTAKSAQRPRPILMTERCHMVTIEPRDHSTESIEGHNDV